MAADQIVYKQRSSNPAPLYHQMITWDAITTSQLLPLNVWASQVCTFKAGERVVKWLARLPCPRKSCWTCRNRQDKNKTKTKRQRPFFTHIEQLNRFDHAGFSWFLVTQRFIKGKKTKQYFCSTLGKWAFLLLKLLNTVFICLNFFFKVLCRVLFTLTFSKIRCVVSMVAFPKWTNLLFFSFN